MASGGTGSGADSPERGQRSAVVTGCGQGIGRATFERLLAAGYEMVGIEANETLANEARERVGARGDVIRGDTADIEVHLQAAARASELAPLWGWVNNAAVQRFTNLHEIVVEDVNRTLAVNLMGYYWGCSAAVKSFIAAGVTGAIVNVSSAHGRAGYPNHSAYDISKGGVDALTRYVAVEYGPIGVRCNAVAPGGVRTPLFDWVCQSSDDPVAAELEAIRPHPLGRIAEPTEIANVIAFLLGSEASFVSGQSLAVDGGLTARCCDFPLTPGLEQAAENLANRSASLGASD